MRTDKNANNLIHIIVIGTSDIHGNILGYDYKNLKDMPGSGMVRLSTYINGIRSSLEANEGLILIDAGDSIQGNILMDKILAKEIEKDHSMIEVMNYLQYDAITLGNHDFDLGIDKLQNIFEFSKAPVLAANAYNNEGLLTGQGYTIINKCGIRLAIIGVTTPFVPVTCSGKEGISQCEFKSAPVAVQDILCEIKGQADAIIVSSHMGYLGEFDDEEGSDSARAIMINNPNLSILQMAHTHINEVGELNGIVYGETKDSMSDVLRYDLYFDEEKNLVDSKVEIINLSCYEKDTNILELPSLKEAHNKALEYVQEGIIEDDESPILGKVEYTFQPEGEINGVPISRLQPTALASLINRLEIIHSGADVSSCNIANPACNFYQGDISLAQIDKIYPFPNFIYLVTVTGKELKNYMEWAVRGYNTMKKEDDAITLNEEYPSYLMDEFLGVEYEVNLANEIGNRIENLTFKGTKVEDGQKFKLAVNNYRFNTNLKKEGIISGKREWMSQITIKDILVNYIKNNRTITPNIENNWKLTFNRC